MHRDMLMVGLHSVKQSARFPLIKQRVKGFREALKKSLITFHKF